VKIGLPLLALLLSAAPLCAELASVKSKHQSARTTLKKAIAGAPVKKPTPAKAVAVKPRTIPAPKPVAKSVPVSTRSIPKAIPVATRITKPAPVRCPECKPVSKSKATASSRKSSSRAKTKVKAAPVIVPNHSEFIDISFPHPPGGRNSTQEKPPAPVKKAEPVEEIPGVPSDRPAENPESIVAKGR
jgi:phage FluMu protein Com